MEGTGDDPVGEVEGLLDPVAMMHVDVDVEDSLMGPSDLVSGWDFYKDLT